MKRFVDMPRQKRAAGLSVSSFDQSANTVDVIWTTGAPVRRNDYREGQYIEELVLDPGCVRLDRLNAGAPFLNTHSSWSLEDVIGSVVPGSAVVQAGRGLATIQLSRAEGDADVVQKIREGVIRNISVGYAIHAVEKTEGDHGVPLWRVTDWEPYELSAVPIPADPGAQTRSGTESPEQAAAEFRRFLDQVIATEASRTIVAIRAQAQGFLDHHGIAMRLGEALPEGGKPVIEQLTLCLRSQIEAAQ